MSHGLQQLNIASKIDQVGSRTTNSILSQSSTLQDYRPTGLARNMHEKQSMMVPLNWLLKMSMLNLDTRIQAQPNEQSVTADVVSSPELAWVETWTDLLDTKYVIPGTKIRFGADFLMGLLPGVGDVLSLGCSGVLVATMAKHGASKLLIARMMLNVLLDTLVGSIPILGNIFDLFYKANYRNMELMREYYHEGKHNGSVWPLAIGIIATIVVAIGLIFWMLMTIASWIWQLL